MARLVLDKLNSGDGDFSYNNYSKFTNLDSTSIQFIVIKLVHGSLHVSPGGELHDPKYVNFSVLNFAISTVTETHPSFLRSL